MQLLIWISFLILSLNASIVFKKDYKGTLIIVISGKNYKLNGFTIEKTDQGKKVNLDVTSFMRHELEQYKKQHRLTAQGVQELKNLLTQSMYHLDQEENKNQDSSRNLKKRIGNKLWDHEEKLYQISNEYQDLLDSIAKNYDQFVTEKEKQSNRDLEILRGENDPAIKKDKIAKYNGEIQLELWSQEIETRKKKLKVTQDAFENLLLQENAFRSELKKAIEEQKQ